MHYVLTLYLAATTSMGNVVPASTPPVFNTVEECLAIGSAYQGTNGETKFTCVGIRGDGNAVETKR